MAILNIVTSSPGLVDVVPSIAYINTNDTLATITTAGYLNGLNDQGYGFYNGQIALVVTSDQGVAWMTVNVTQNNISLQIDVNPGTVLLPTVTGHFSVFANTTGGMKDAGFSPSNAAKTKVVMANGAVGDNHIAVYTDANGTIGADAATAINAGNIQAGESGIAGGLISYSSTASKGSLIIQAVANANNTNTTISNAAMGQASVISIPDPGASTANFMINTLASGSVSAPVVSFAITVGYAALASAGKVNLIVSSGSMAFQITGLWLGKVGTDFSGGSGDRLLAISDGTSVYSVIPAADLQTLVNAKWGDTALPAPASVSYGLPTAAGATLYAQYSGGANDYTAGTCTLYGTAVRVA